MDFRGLEFNGSGIITGTDEALDDLTAPSGDPVFSTPPKNDKNRADRVLLHLVSAGQAVGTLKTTIHYMDGEEHATAQKKKDILQAAFDRFLEASKELFAAIGQQIDTLDMDISTVVRELDQAIKTLNENDMPKAAKKLTAHKTKFESYKSKVSNLKREHSNARDQNSLQTVSEKTDRLESSVGGDARVISRDLQTIAIERKPDFDFVAHVEKQDSDKPKPRKTSDDKTEDSNPRPEA